MGTIFKLLFILFLVSCTSLIYQPDKYLHADPKKFGLDYIESVVPSFDGTPLVSWTLKSKSENPQNLVLMFHGNAENMTSHFLNLAWLTNFNSDVIVFDYRGYGLSKGTPYPRGVAEDGLKFLELAHEQFKKGNYKKFIVYTQSIGGAIALRSLENFKFKDEISLLVLDSTFRDPQIVAQQKTNWFLSRLISAEETANKNLSHITMPTLVIHSQYDPVIPYVNGQEIFNIIPTQQKWFWSLKTQGHGDVFFTSEGKYRKELLSLFMK